MKTAKEYLATDASLDFRILCEKAGAEATRRQVLKFRNKRGKAYRFSVDFNRHLHISLD